MPENQRIKELLEKSRTKTKSTTTKSTTTTKAPAKSRVVTTSKKAEADSKNKILATQAAYNVAVDEKSLSKTQKAVIATGLTLAVATAVVVPLSVHLINSNKMFDITISSNYNMESTEHETVSVEPGTLISQLTPISREGFVFKGWYKDSACTEAYPLDYEIKEDDVIFALLEVEVVDINLSVYINGQLTTITTQSGKTLEQALEENGINIDEISIPGHHLVGLFKDPQGEKTYPNGYIIKKTDSTIYALFEMNTYLITFPEIQEGYYIMDIAGNQITSTQRVTYGQDFSFKVFIADGYFGNDLKVVANAEVIESENEIYTFTNIGSNFNIEITGVKSIEDISFTVALNGLESTTYHTTSDMTFKEFFEQAELPYTEETTAGIFTNAELTESVSFDTTINKNATYYIYTATTEKLAFTELADGTYSVSAANYDITGDIVIPSYYNGQQVTAVSDYAFVNFDETDEETGFPKVVQLSNIVLPGTISTIGEMSFAYSSLSSIVLPEGVTKIQTGAFAVSSIESILLPSTLTIIGEMSFLSCSKLYEIHIPENVQDIEKMAFSQCENLTIYCEWAESEPGSWNDKWNPTNCPVVWAEKTYFGTELWKGYKVLDKVVLETYMGESTDGVVIIPREVDGFKITNLSATLFEGHKDNISYVYIPNSIVDIEARVLYQGGKYILNSVFKAMTNVTVLCESESEPGSWEGPWNITSYSEYGDIDFGYLDVLWGVKEFKNNSEWKYVVHNDNTITLVKYIGNKQDIVIPRQIDGHVVYNLNCNLFDSKMSKVFITKNIVNMLVKPNHNYGGALEYRRPFINQNGLVIYVEDGCNYDLWIKEWNSTIAQPVSGATIGVLLTVNYNQSIDITTDWDV